MRKRKYNLSPEGLKRLQEAAQRNKPWEASTGPKTTEGKHVVAGNAFKHGQYFMSRYLRPEQVGIASTAELMLLMKVCSYTCGFCGIREVEKWAYRLLQIDPENPVGQALRSLARAFADRQGVPIPDEPRHGEK